MQAPSARPLRATEMRRPGVDIVASTIPDRADPGRRLNRSVVQYMRVRPVLDGALERRWWLRHECNSRAAIVVLDVGDNLRTLCPLVTVLDSSAARRSVPSAAETLRTDPAAAIVLRYGHAR